MAISTFGGTASLPGKYSYDSSTGKTTKISDGGSTSNTTNSTKTGGGSSGTKAQDAAYNELMKQIQGGATATSGKALDVGAITSAYTGAGGKFTSDQQKILDTITKGTAVNTSMLNNPVKPVTLPTQPVTQPFIPNAPVIDTTPNEPSMIENAQAVADFLGEAQPERIDRQKIEKQTGLTDIKQRVNALASQISGLQAQNQTDILTARNQSSAEGGTAGILSAREDAINRSYATKILPLNAQYQSELGNQQMAQEMVTAYIADENAYQDRLYAYKKDIGSMFLSAMNADQQRRWELTDQANANLRDDIKTNNSWKQQAWQQATDNGQYSLASKILSLDATSPTFMTELGNYTKNISSGVSTKAPTIQKINGVDMQWEPTTGTWVKPSVSQTTGEDLTKDQLSISSVDTLLNNKTGAATAVGTSYLSRSTGFWGNIGRILTSMAAYGTAGTIAGSVIPGVGTVVGGVTGLAAGLFGGLMQTGVQSASQLSGAEQSFIGSVEQLVSGLTLESLIDAKARGATFGALSEGEMNVLSQSATKIGKWARKDKDDNVIGYNVDETSFKNELQTINNMAKLDYLRKGGKAEDIGVNITPDGRMWVKDWRGNLSEIRTY